MTSDNKNYFPIFVLAIAFFADLLSPFLISRGIIPSSLRWISQGVILMVIIWVLFRMLVYQRIPLGFLLIVVLTLIGFITAFWNGQGIAITAWGWWLMFQFPMVGLFTYIQTDWPKDFPNLLLWSCIAILGFEVMLQIFEYLGGTVPGDQLSGSFGQSGTGNLVLFIILVLCLTLGEWLASGKWIPLFLSLGFGLISSLLGEMKFFLPVTILLAGLALVLFTIRAKKLWKLIPIGIFVTIIVITFFVAYDKIVPGARQYPLERYLNNPQLLTSYLNISNRYGSSKGYYTDIGRNFALQYGWNQINKDPMTLLFGFGLGARSDSSSLGLVGQSLARGDLGVSTGTSFLVIIEETGLVGLTVLGVFILVVLITSFNHIRKQPASVANGLRYGIILFSMLWPLWIWYNTAWILRVPMMLYWIILGYLFDEFNRGSVCWLKPYLAGFPGAGQ